METTQELRAKAVELAIKSFGEFQAMDSDLISRAETIYAFLIKDNAPSNL